MSDDHKLTPEEWVQSNRVVANDADRPGTYLPDGLVLAELERLTARAEKAEKERDEWKANAEAAEEECERRRDRAKSAERERDAHRAACEKAERDRDEARAEFHRSNEHHCRHVAQLEARVEKAERACAAMREQLEAVLEMATDPSAGVGSSSVMRPGAKGWSIASVRAALASDAGREFLSRNQVFEVLLRFGPEAPSAEEVIKERDRGH